MSAKKSASTKSTLTIVLMTPTPWRMQVSAIAGPSAISIGSAGLLPLGDGVVRQPPRQHQQTFVLAARADARAQLADGAPAARPAAELEPDQAARRARPAPAQRLDVDRAFDALDERRRTEPLALQQHARQRLEGRRRQLRDAPFQRRRGPLAQRAPRLAEHLLGALQLRVGRTTRQRVQTRARRAHARAHPGPQPLARLGGQRRAHHAPRFVGLAVNQPPARRPVRDLADVHAASRAPARAGSPARRRPAS